MAWMNILHKEPSSKVRVNGHPPIFFRVEWRVRQVDSLSPILFVLSIETGRDFLPKCTDIRDS